MKNLSIFLLSAVVTYLLFTFVTFNPFWISEGAWEYVFYRIIYLCVTAIVFIFSKIVKIP